MPGYRTSARRRQRNNRLPTGVLYGRHFSTATYKHIDEDGTGRLTGTVQLSDMSTSMTAANRLYTGGLTVAQIPTGVYNNMDDDGTVSLTN